AVAASGLELSSGSGSTEAADGSQITAGATTTAEASTTLLYNGNNTFSGVIFLANGTTEFAATDTAYPAAIGGWAGQTGASTGVYGFTESATGNGVVGVASAAGAIGV